MARILAAVGLLSVVSLAAFAQGEKEEKAESKTKNEATVLVVTGTQPFTVEKGEIVRLTGDGIAGSQITASVDGPAKIVREAAVVRIIDGERPFGPGNREFDLKPTGTGEVTVEITVKNPTSPEPEVTTYHFTVE